MRWQHYLYLIILIGMFSSCTGNERFELRTGDLLFRGRTPSALSSAIDEVTQTGDGNHFSHVGLVEVIAGEVYVIHAEGEKGVCRQPVDSFMTDDTGEKLYAEAFRVKDDFRKGIGEAVKRAASAIGEPYNYTYIIEDSGYYCSELIWWAFSPDSVFALSPMTFKDPVSGRFHDGWVRHYEKLGMDIPEGLPGCNPNGMAASDNIYRLGVVSEEHF